MRNATKDLTLNIAEEIIAKIYERFRNPRLGTVDNWIWPFEGDDEDRLDDHLALAISRLLHESCTTEEEDEDEVDS